jgi:hypothetical protein
MSDPLPGIEENRRNMFRIQESALRVCAALRKIADGCPNPETVALKALNYKAPEPNWAEIEETRS